MQRITPPYSQAVLDESDVTVGTVSEILDLGTLPIRASVQFVVTGSAPVKTFDNEVVAAFTVTLANHGYATGVEVDYNVDSGITLDNLVDNTNYFVIRLTDNTFQLAATYADAIAGTEIEIADGGAGEFTLTPVAPGGTVKVYGSNDDTNYTQLDTDTFTATSSFLQEFPTISVRYLKLEANVTAGQIDVQGIVHTKL